MNYLLIIMIAYYNPSLSFSKSTPTQIITPFDCCVYFDGALPTLKLPPLNGTIDGSAADRGTVNGHAISGGTIDGGGIDGAIGGVGPIE